MNTFASSSRPKPYCINSTGYNPGSYFQGVNSFASSSGPKPQCVNSTGCNPGLHLQDAKSSGLTSISKLQGMKPCELNSRTKIQSKASIIVNSEPYFQGMKSSELIPGTKFQGVQFSENEQVVQPVFTLGPLLNDEKSVVVFPDPLLKNVKSEESRKPSKPPLSGIDSVKLISGSGLKNLKYEFAPELCFQNLQSVELRPESQQRALNSQELNIGWQGVKSIVLAPEPTRKLSPGPELTSVKFSNLFPESQQQDMTLEFTPQQKLQSIKYTELSSLSLQQIPKSVVLAPRALPQTVKSGNQCLRTSYPITESSDIIPRIGHHCVEYAEIIPKPRHQDPEYVNSISIPTYQVIESSEKTEGLVHKGTDTVEKFVGLTPKPIRKAMESSRTPLQIDIQVSEFVDLTSVQNDQEPKSLEFTTGKNHKIPATLGFQHSDIPGVAIISKERMTRKQVEKLEDSLQSYSQHPLQSWRPPLGSFQAGLGAQRDSVRSFLGRQQNVWESHAYRQRLPRKYLSTMLMLGNVLETTMERKVSSQTCLAKRSGTDICQSVQNLFGVPAELMEFSQPQLKKGPDTISKPSVFKNYIQRHPLCHGHEKRMGLRIWTRGFPSSIIQQYSGTRLRIKKSNSKLSDEFQEVTQYMPMPCVGDQLPTLVESETSFRIFHNQEDLTPCESCDSQTRIFEPLQSQKPSYFSRAKKDFSDQSHLLQDLQLKIAAKLMRSQIPPNVPPPLASGLVLKYPICPQCGQCSGFNCNHTILHSTSGPYILIYPQLHLVRTPEGHAKVQVRLGFRLRTGKRPQVSKYHGRDRHTIPRSFISLSQKKAKIYPPASKNVGPTNFQFGSSQCPVLSQVHIRKKQQDSPELVKQTEIEESRHYEFPTVRALSDSDFESNQDEKFTEMRTKKSSDSKYPTKRITKGPRAQNTKFHTYNRTTIENTTGELPATLRRKRIGATQTNTASLKRQPKKSSHSKFMQLLFQGLKKVYQTAHRIMPFVGEKPEDGRIDNLRSSENYNSQQKSRDYNLARDKKGERMPADKQRATSPITKQKDVFCGSSDKWRSAQELQKDSFSHLRPLQLLKPTASQRGITSHTTSIIHPLGTVQNVSGSTAKKNFHRDEISSQESKKLLKPGTRVQAQWRNLPGSLQKKTLQSHLREKHTHKVGKHHGSYRNRTQHNPSDKSSGSPYHSHHLSPSERRPRSPSERRCRSPSERRHRSPSERRHHRRHSERSRRGASERSHGSRSETTTPHHPSERSGHTSGTTLHSCSEKSHPGPLERAHPRTTDRTRHSYSERSQRSSQRSRSRSRSRRRSGTEKIQHSPAKERLKDNSPKERPRHSLATDFKGYSNLSPRDTTKKSKSRAHLEARSC
ncbi:uncharacterized protein C2orf16 homolog [Octodon degus]|uniref:Uncharacterized protein C2orf16 homolog n=1 Tax=Octodon degus TaxID=10160 RepID=A0A6P6E4I1_OCTDE|nr:uncharacterized protein C2orf16 homolog [Octodon degus]